MSEQSFVSKFCSLFENRRGSYPTNYSPVELAAILADRKFLPQQYEILEITNRLAKFFGAYGPMPIPPVLSKTILKILVSHSAKTILDPWAGLGALLAIAQQATSAERCIGYNPNTSEGELAKMLFPEAEWSIGQSLSLLRTLDEPIDVVVSCPPFGVRTRESLTLVNMAGNPINLKDKLGNLILAATTARLSENGVGLFVVPASFFYSGRSVLKYFPDLGFSVDAALALPLGSFAPCTSIDTYLLVVRKGTNKKMFVAQLSSDQNTNAQILENYTKGEEGGAFELGRYVDALEFRSIDSLRAGDYFQSASKQIGFPAVPLENLAMEINLGCFGNEFKFPEVGNAVFVPIIGQSDVVDSIDNLTLKAQSYAQVVIDPSKSSATFIAQFLNSELGKKTREWRKLGTFPPKLNKQVLKKIQVLIPDLTTQQKMIEIEGRLSGEENTLLSLENDLSELRRKLWKNPRSADDVDDQLSKFSSRLAGNLKKQAAIGLKQWFETIPFPLASILRAWQATSSDDYKTKYEHLLQFFEATAEFISVILLSAFSRKDSFYDPHKKKLNEIMAKQHLSFQRATFGTWKLVVEYLGKQTRMLLQEDGKKLDDAKNDRSICADLFFDSTLKFPRLLCGKEIADILGVTNKMRNTWSGHGGIVSQEEAKLRNEKLLGQVERLRGAMADAWDSSLIVNALFCLPRKGVFENQIAILKGSNSEFLKESRNMSMWLDVDSLYLINGDQSNALKLLPLVQVKASPGTAKNACYFFSRTVPAGLRFVSYNFEGQPELSGPFEEATDAIKFLSKD
ncbi:MAG: N-6 DNA methylase [Lentisphaeria bacterium]